jgi:signal transduction histidine kinase
MPHQSAARRKLPAAEDTAALERFIDRQTTLLGFLESISSESDLQPLLTRILRYACELIGADHGTIGLVDEQANVVRTEAIYNMPADELGAVMPPGIGIAGTALLTRQPVVLDRYGDVSVPSRHDSLENPVIGMPIVWLGRMVGFFGIGIDIEQAACEGRTSRRFTTKDLDSLAMFARYAAIAIQNARRYEREQQRAERIALIARIGHIVAAHLDLQDLLQRTADAIHELLGYPNVAIPLLDPADPSTLVLKTVGGFYKDIVKGEYRIPIAEGIMGAAARTRQIVLVNDVSQDPRYLPTPGATGITAELAVPILLGDNMLAVLNVEAGSPFSGEDAASLQIVADQLAVAMENARLYGRAQQLAALEERQRLARDLHDSVTQHIFGMNLIAQSLAPAWRRDPAEGDRRIARMLELSRTALAEMRALLAELRPAGTTANETEPRVTSALVRDCGLADALRQHAAALEGPYIIVDASLYRAQPAEVEQELFRICQEALNNVIKHARAKRVVVQLITSDADVSLVIQDDGIGFKPEDVENDRNRQPAGGGLGLLTMRERAHALGGRLQTRSTPDLGTRVEVHIPPRGSTP